MEFLKGHWPLISISKRNRQASFSAAKSLWEDFCRHLKFLQAEGFVNESSRLTEDGYWAARLRLDHPLLVAQCLRERAFPEEDEKIMAAIVAVFAYDRDAEIGLIAKNLPPKLMSALKKVMLGRPTALPPFAGGFVYDGKTLSGGRSGYVLLGAGTQLGKCDKSNRNH